MRLSPVALLLMLAMAGFAVPLAGQAKSARSGFWAGAGIGAGSERLSCTICQGDRDTDFSGYVRLGWTLSPHVLIGAESDGWRQSTNGIDEILGTLHGVAYWYPSATKGFYAKAGFGVLGYWVDGGGSELRGQALSGQIGFGYDLRLTRQFYFTPFINLIGSMGGHLDLNGNTAADGVSYSLVQAGFGITLY